LFFGHIHFLAIVSPCLFRHSHRWRIIFFHLWIIIGLPVGTWWFVVFFGLVTDSHGIRNGFAGTP
jgi:hypothetical protein